MTHCERVSRTHCERVSWTWLVMAVQGIHHEDQLTEQERRVPAENSTKRVPSEREVSLFRRGWIRQSVALWKGELLSWLHPLNPLAPPQPQLDCLFFDSS